MHLNIISRKGGAKSELGRIRRAGDIPAVIYSQGNVGRNIVVKGAEFKAFMRTLKQGCLSTTIFTIQEGSEKARALVKDIQYHRTSYDVLHIDFVELKKDVKVRVKVPIQCTGVVDCAGVKLGGVLRQVLRHFPVECAPDNIPNEFSIDVSELNIMQTKRLSDIGLPKDVRPLGNVKEVAVVVAKR